MERVPPFNDLVISLDGGESPVDEMLVRHLPHMVALFRSKARDYASSDSFFTADVLGSRGQFAEIWRKVGKLKRCMWDNQDMKYEQVDEILADLFGHIVLGMDYINGESIRSKYKSK